MSLEAWLTTGRQAIKVQKWHAQPGKLFQIRAAATGKAWFRWWTVIREEREFTNTMSWMTAKSYHHHEELIWSAHHQYCSHTAVYLSSGVDWKWRTWKLRTIKIARHENDGPNLQGIKLQNLTTLNTLALIIHAVAFSKWQWIASVPLWFLYFVCTL